MAFIKQEFVDGVTVVQAAWLNGIQEVVGAGAVAPEYNPEQTYAIGTLVSHNAQLYICTTTIASPEAWNSAHWMATSLQALVSEQKGVYWCAYSVSTYAQVDNAKSKSMLPICTYDFTVDGVRYRGTAVYAYISNGSYVFFDCCENGTFLKLYIDSESTWTRELLNPLVPVGRTVNGKALSTNIALDAEDIQYDSSLVSHEAGSIGYELNSLNEKDTELESSISAVKGIFWVTDEVTTAQQIEDALSSNKFPILLPTTIYPTVYMPFVTREQIDMTDDNSEYYRYMFQGVNGRKVYIQSLLFNATTGVGTWSQLSSSDSFVYNSMLNELRNNIATAYSNSSAYAVGDYVFRNSTLYRCKTAIASGEAWNSSKWEQVVLADEVTSIKNDVSNIKEIFVVIDGETTAQEIDDALTAGKYPILNPTNGGPERPLMPYASMQFSVEVDENDTMHWITSYVFESLQEDGMCFSQTLTADRTAGVETWQTISYTQALTKQSEFDNVRNSIALTYSNTSTYAVGDYVFYGTNLYRCITKINTAESWHSNKWEQVVLTNEVKKRKVFWTTVDNIQKADEAFNDGCYLLAEYNFTQNGTTFKGVATYSYKTTSSSSVNYYFFDYDGRHRIQVLYGYGDNSTMEIHAALDLFDSQMSDSSERAVQNKVIKAYVDSVVAYGMNIVDVSGTTPTINAQAETRYVCGEVTSLTISSLPQRGIADIMFTSGSTPTVLTLPNTVIMPAWFDATSLDTNTTYEINIMDGVYGTVMQWA